MPTIKQPRRKNLVVSHRALYSYNLLTIIRVKKSKTLLSDWWVTWRREGEWIICMQIFFFFESWQAEACAWFLKSLICCVSFSLKSCKDRNEIHDLNKTRFGMELDKSSEWVRVQGDGIYLVLKVIEGGKIWSTLVPFYLRKKVSLSLPFFLSWCLFFF